GGSDVAVRVDRRRVRAGPPGDRRGDSRAAPCSRQLLHQRQADRRGRGSAAVRRGARIGNERQGGIEAEPGALGERPDDQGELRAAARVSVSVHGSGVRAGARGSGLAAGCASLAIPILDSASPEPPAPSPYVDSGAVFRTGLKNGVLTTTAGTRWRTASTVTST